jgi:tetratricopeptide (TPR) repeat protein
VADQSGKSLDLPAAERSALIIAMSLHEKGRAALKRRDYPAALVLLLEADSEFAACSSDLLRMVDNYAILSLDIAWCYLSLHAVSELPLAEERLRACEEKFKESYGSDMERVAALKGSTGNESALLVRLNLLQGIVAFHLGRDREARLLLEKCSVQLQMLAVSESDLLEIASMGYSLAEARLGLRAAVGNRKEAVEHIMRRREEKEALHRKEREERERGDLREKLGRCADGSWVNVGYYKTLISMGYTEVTANTALVFPF